MTKLSTKKIKDLFVQEDLKHYGYDEDGSAVELPVQFVVAEMNDGSRYAHHKTFEQQPEKAEALCCRVGRASTIDLSQWTPIDPCYGSEAYEWLDNKGYFHNREKREELS